MQDATNLITELIKAFKDSPPINYPGKKLNDPKEGVFLELKESNKVLMRAVAVLKTELKNSDLIKEKNDMTFTKYNNEKFKLAKRMVALERDIEDLRVKISHWREEERRLQESIALLKQPSVNKLFLELMSGFNVQFLKGKCKVINVKKNDVIEIETRALKECEISNRIWGAL